jgi:signal transduction histidine kinase
LGLCLNLLRSAPPPHSGSASKPLEDALALVEQTAERVRGVMADLRPPVLDDYGLLAALRWHGAEISRRTGIEVVVDARREIPRLTAAVEHALFRIAQEAFNNVSKHARATQAQLWLERRKDSVTMEIADNGVGFDAASLPGRHPPTWGMQTMAERAAGVGGRLEVNSHPGHGTVLLVEVPL